MSLVSEKYIYLLTPSPVVLETSYCTIRIRCQLANRNITKQGDSDSEVMICFGT